MVESLSHHFLTCDLNQQLCLPLSLTSIIAKKLVGDFIAKLEHMLNSVCKVSKFLQNQNR